MIENSWLEDLRLQNLRIAYARTSDAELALATLADDNHLVGLPRVVKTNGP